MNKRYLISAVVIGLMLVGAACSKENNGTTGETENSNEAVSNVNATEDANENVNVARNTNSDDKNKNTNASSADNEDNGPTTNGTLTVNNPQAGKTVVSPLEVEGRSDTDKVYVRVKNSAGSTLFTETVTVRGGEFNVHLTLSFTNSKTFSIEVFQKDSAGAELNLVSIPLNFKAETASDDSNTNSDANDNANESNSNDS